MDPEVRSRFEGLLERLRGARGRSLFADAGDGMHFPEFAVLCRVRELIDSGTSASVKELQRDTHVSKPAVSQILGSLERRGLIRREIDGGDRRRIAVTLTPEGEAARKRAVERHEEVFAELISRFGEDNARAFNDLLDRFIEVVERYRRESFEGE